MAQNARVEPHALVLLFPSQGHIAPLITLAFRLANNGIRITLASFRKYISSIKAKYAEKLQSLDVHLMELDHDPGHIDNVKITVPVLSEALRRGIRPVVEKLEADRLAGNAIPTCIIADYLFLWSEDVAAQLSVELYVFFSGGTILARLLQEVPVLLDTGKLQIGDDKKVKPFDGVIDIPDVASLHYSELPLSVRILFLRIKSSREDQGVSRRIVVNTFYDLEPKPIDSYRNFYSNTQSGRKATKVYDIGPVVTTATFSDHAFNSAMVSTGFDCLTWLDSQPVASVVFICLGSMVRLSPPQIEQLALALEASKNCRFLWVLHKGNGNFELLEDVLPPDFEAKVKGRGMVTIGWIPQLQVLTHAALLGFLSHCGWCSTIESLTSGVPILGWPQRAEQFLNCRYLVDELKVATEVFRGDDGIVQQKEFEKAFAVLYGDQGKTMKEICQQLRLKGAAAIAPGGSSDIAFLQLVEDMKS